MKSYDAIVIGSGQGGTPLAKKLAKAGWRTALVESDELGGTCVNNGCTPTKTMIGAARMIYMAHRAENFGVWVDRSNIDIKAIIGKKDEIVRQFRESIQEDIQKTLHLDLIHAAAVFTGPKTIQAGDEMLRGKHIFINTGARPSIPRIEGLEHVPYHTSDSIIRLEEIPSHLLILGSGYIAMELGQMYRRFGSEVTIIEKGSRFLSREDEDVADELVKIFEEDGIRMINDTVASKASGEDAITLTTASGQSISGSHLLIATGRVPNTERLNLELAGVATDEHGYIIVNEKLETNVQGIYALGDVKGGPAFTHISYNDHLLILENLLEGGNASTTGRPVPYCMFTDPELGRIGLTEREAQEKGLRISIARLPVSSVARGIETGETRGLMKAVVDADTKQILGAAILCVNGGEIMSVLQMAMSGGITADQVQTYIFAHPVYAESLNNLFMTL